MSLEKTILKNLLKNETYTRKVLPYLKDEYFTIEEERAVFREIENFIGKYNKAPTLDALAIELDALANLTETQAKGVRAIVDDLKADDIDTNTDWLIDSTEKFCQEKSIYLAIMNSIDIMNNPKSKLSKGAIPQLLADALAVSFDPNVGHDFLEQSDERFEYYHRIEEKIPFDLEFFNKITKGGVNKKTLNMIMGGVHTGKTMFMCHFAAAYLAQGKNVLYITLEMAEEEIAKRIDTNLLNVTFDDLDKLSKDMYDKKINSLKTKTQGKLIIKEYPSTSASVLHFKALLNELKLKNDFIPDVILIDYLNICASARLAASAATDTYQYVKSIAEEVRGLSQQVGIPIWSATQLNRTGFGSSDPDMTNVAESFGLPATADLLLVLISTEELRELNQIMVKQLKNRYHNYEENKRFVIGVDKAKQKLYDVEASAQDIVDSGQEKEQKNLQEVKNKFRKLTV
jgi:replicative DNA helicase